MPGGFPLSSEHTPNIDATQVPLPRSISPTVIEIPEQTTEIELSLTSPVERVTPTESMLNRAWTRFGGVNVVTSDVNTPSPSTPSTTISTPISMLPLPVTGGRYAILPVNVRGPFSDTVINTPESSSTTLINE